MKRFIIKRIVFIPFAFIGITLIMFFLINLLPPSILATAYQSSEKELSEEEVKTLIEKYDLDKGFLKRYKAWLFKVLSGDFGYSYSARMSVVNAVKTYFPATFELAFFSILLVVLVGNYFGLKSAFKRGGIIDKSVNFISVFFYSMPSFVIGIVILYLFYGVLGVIKPQRYSIETEILISTGRFVNYTGLMLLDSLMNMNIKVFVDSLVHITGPAISLFIGTFAVFLKVTKTSALEEIKKDYIKTLKVKGLSDDYIMNFHVRRNVLIPQITIGGLQTIKLLSGVVITETIFDWPGIGSWGVKSAIQLDINGIVGFALVTCALFLIGNLIIDILYFIVDPRIRYG